MKATDDEYRLLQVAKLEHLEAQLRSFVKESNRIENIFREPTVEEITAHRMFLDRPKLYTDALEKFVSLIQPDATLRSEVGQNVSIVDLGTGEVKFRAPKGGPSIPDRLAQLLSSINGGLMTPAEAHAEYETLHPFTDGNGRSGRVIWAWQMLKLGGEPFGLGFLRQWYYQSLDITRRSRENG